MTTMTFVTADEIKVGDRITWLKGGTEMMSLDESVELARNAREVKRITDFHFIVDWTGMTGPDELGIDRDFFQFARVTEDEPEPEPFRGSRLVQFEVPDVRAEDLLTIALQRFNEEFPDEPVRYRHLGSMIIGNPKEFS